MTIKMIDSEERPYDHHLAWFQFELDELLCSTKYDPITSNVLLTKC